MTMFLPINVLLLLVTLANIVRPEDPLQDKCKEVSSCSSCLTYSHCVWCVTKSRCTKQNCGNDNVIYPNYSSALLSGPQFCPRISELQQPIIIQSGKMEILSIKITQIYLYMAFTPWKCKITIDGKEFIVKAILIADLVHCESVALVNESDNAYMDGQVKVIWDYSKAFDGFQPIQVCRCDLDPSCLACKK